MTDSDELFVYGAGLIFLNLAGFLILSHYLNGQLRAVTSKRILVVDTAASSLQKTPISVRVELSGVIVKSRSYLSTYRLSAWLTPY